MVRDYRNPNKPSWSEAIIKEKHGPQSYSCILPHNNYVIKRHLDQIRGQNIPQTQERSECNINISSGNNNSSSVPQQLRTTEEASHIRRELRQREGGRVVKTPEVVTKLK